jgi:nickel/cobalt transporter (NiCoT) family protein
MCLIDTTDGALMLSLYVQPAANFLPPTPTTETHAEPQLETEVETAAEQPLDPRPSDQIEEEHPTPQNTDITNLDNNDNHRDPVAFLYYSIVLTTLTVMVALVIGILQVLSLVWNVTGLTGPFWHGVEVANDYYDAIGGGICGCFVIVGTLSVFCYKPWRRWVGIDDDAKNAASANLEEKRVDAKEGYTSDENRKDGSTVVSADVKA